MFGGEVMVDDLREGVVVVMRRFFDEDGRAMSCWSAEFDDGECLLFVDVGGFGSRENAPEVQLREGKWATFRASPLDQAPSRRRFAKGWGLGVQPTVLVGVARHPCG